MKTHVLPVSCFAVLCASFSASHGQTLLRAPSEAPEYRLGRIRVEDDRFGRTTLVFDYTRTRAGEGRVRLAGRTPDGPLQINFAPNVNQASGEIRLSKSIGGRGGAYDYEFYLVVPAYWAEKSYGDCLISNKVQIGNPGSGPSARRWTDAERAAYEKNKLKETPPTRVRSGYEPVRFDTPLAPGMRVLAGHYGDWVPAELLQLSEAGKASVRFLENDRVILVDAEGFLAASPDMLSRAASDPGSFRPSLRLLPGGVAPLPSDAGPVPDSASLPVGTPLLKVEHGATWKEVFVVEDLGGSVKTTDAHTRDFHGRRNGKLIFAPPSKRSSLAIRRSVLSDLDDPAKAEEWAVNVIPEKERRFGSDGSERFGAGGFDGKDPLEDYHVIDRSYPIEAPIPRRTRKLPRDVEIEPGSPVAYNDFSDDWEACTLLLDEGDTVVIHENGSRSSFAYRLPRYQVIIEDKTLRKMQNASADKAADLQKTLRTWTDSTGQHKVEARFLAVADGKVKLRTDAGREITLPMERLCEEDQELLESLASLTDNPFE